jgi:hypothetical protein
MRDSKQQVDRRQALAGAGAVGALTAVAAVLPGLRTEAAATAQGAAQALPDTAAGYRLTEHVKRYYASTRI